MSSSTISISILITLVISSQACTADASANTFSYVAQCQTSPYNLSSGNSSIQCAGCLEYEASETMVESCSTDNQTLFDFTYKCRSCQPGYTINQANSTLSHIYSNMSLGSANVSFAGDCVGTEVTPKVQYNNFSQVVNCFDSVSTYSLHNAGQDTQIICGNCSKFALTRDLSMSTYNISGMHQIAYSYACLACDNGQSPSTLANYGVIMSGNVSIDLSSSCGNAVEGHGGEFRSKSAKIAHFTIIVIVATATVLLN